jgi:hypothetical protein
MNRLRTGFLGEFVLVSMLLAVFFGSLAAVAGLFWVSPWLGLPAVFVWITVIVTLRGSV